MQQFLFKFKIRTKLLAGFTVLLFILLLAFSLIRLKLFHISDGVNWILHDHHPVEQMSYQLHTELDHATASLMMFLSLHDEISASRFRRELTNAYSITDQLQQSEVVLQEPHSVKILVKIRQHIDELNEYGEQLLQTGDDETHIPGLADANNHLSSISHQIEKLVEELIQAQQAMADHIANQLLIDDKEISNLADLFLFLAIITGIGTALVISRMIAKPIHHIADVMVNIASGEADLTQRLDASGKDEVARLARSFNTFVIKAQHRAEEERALSNLLRLSLKPTSLDTYLNDTIKILIETVAWLGLEPKGCIFINPHGLCKELKLVSTYNFSVSSWNRCATVPFGQCLCGRAAQSRKIVFATPMDDCPDRRCEDIPSHGHYCVPIQSENTLLGVLTLYLAEGHEHSDYEEAFLSKVAEVLSMGIYLRQKNDELFVAKQRAESFSDQLTNITANIPGIIYQCIRTPDNEFIYPFVSPGTALLLGKVTDNPIRDIHQLFSNVHAQDRERLEQAIDHSSTNSLPINIEYRINLEGDGTRWILCNAVPRQTEDGNILWDGILLDITGRKNLENELLQAQKLKSVGQLAAGIAHEINTPTQYVKDNTLFLQEAFNGYIKTFAVYKQLRAHLADSDIPAEWLKPIDESNAAVDINYLNEEIPQAISENLEGLERISSIVSAMKEFTHPGTYAQQPVDINAVIENLATVTRNEWKYVADLELDLSDDLPSPMGFRDKIGQVIMNLIVNAAQAIGDNITAGKYKKGHIIITSSYRNGLIEIRVSDNGPGIPEAIQEKIFDPFFTTKEVGKGTGQGLSISHSVIVEQHHGSLTVESKPDEGASFIIHLPADEPPVKLAANN